ncbi:MAG: hypothetical protein RMJ56_09955 [Gemmataceae bacterium]|nr:hypothetical protein [Gemmata sp.]MDW8197913.1 hypothetical protein [Gemmataceae bacterium]
MNPMLKCPNPSCPYIFDPTQVPAGVILCCPRCAMQFQLAPTPPAAAPSPAAATAPASPPVAPSASPPAPGWDEGFPPRGANRFQAIILAIIAIVLMSGSALAVIFMITRRSEPTAQSTLTRLPDINMVLHEVPAGWQRDEELRAKLAGPYVLAFRHEQPEAYVAIGAWEPKEKGRMPRPSEMRADLDAAFPKLFDVQTVDKQPPHETAWLGQTIAAGMGHTFRAQSQDGLIWRGEAYAVAYKGLAYYWLSWCGENDYDTMKSHFAEFRGKFQLLDLRKNWKETRSNVTHYKGEQIPYTLTDADDRWRPVPANELQMFKEAEGELDQRLRIVITPRNDPRGQPATAELSVYVLDTSGGDATQIARQYAEKLETARVGAAGPPTFHELTDEVQGDPIPTDVPSPTPVIRLATNVKDAQNANRLIVVSGLTIGNKTVVVVCWCPLTERARFEKRLVQIASSLRS